MLKDVCDFVGGISADYYIHRENRVVFGSYFGIAEELFSEYLSDYVKGGEKLDQRGGGKVDQIR
jgi:hypothetical protein